MVSIAICRSGLTDVSFGFWLLAGLFCFSEAERRASWRWAVLAGLATGLAWNTKYHGWLAVVISAVAVLMATRWADRRTTAASAGRLVVMGGLATALYIPWAMYVSGEPGGYGLLIEHQDQFVRPFLAHLQAWAHFRAQLGLDGWLGRLAPTLAALGVVASTSREGRADRWVRAGVVGAFGIVLGLTVFSGLAAIVAVLLLLPSREAGARVASAFFVVFSLLTPLYFPYPRLLLPWFMASVLLSGATIHWFVAGRVPATPGPNPIPPALGFRARAALSILAVGLSGLCLVLRPPWESGHTYEPKDGFREAAAQIAQTVGPGAQVLVWDEPAVAFYLRSHGIPADPIVDLRQLPTDERAEPLYLVTSLYAARVPGEYGLDGWRDRHPGQLTELARVPVRALSGVRLLDDFDLETAARFRQDERTDYDLHLHVVSQR